MDDKIFAEQPPKPFVNNFIIFCWYERFLYLGDSSANFPNTSLTI